MKQNETESFLHKRLVKKIHESHSYLTPFLKCIIKDLLSTAVFILVVSSAVLVYDIRHVSVTCRWGSLSFLLIEFCCCHSKKSTED